MKTRTTAMTLITAIFLLPLIAFATPFQDVLDTPALKSVHADKTLLVGVATAGKRIVCVGQHGHIVYSDNQGKSWTQAAVPVSSDLLAVVFPTAQNGWAVGHDGVVLHTSDAGVNWQKQFDGRAAARVMASHYLGTDGGSPGNDPGSAPNGSPAARPAAAATADIRAEIQKFIDQGPDKPFLDVWFENETTGFIVGAFNLIFRTTDGGKSWIPWYDRIDNAKHFHLYAIHPVGRDLFITSEQGTLFKLDQAKSRFQEIRTAYTGTFFGVTGKQGAVVAYGMRGNAFTSRDNGASWKKVETGVPTGLMGSTITPDGRIVLVSQGGHLLVSSDDGRSFTQAKVDQVTPAAAVAAVDGKVLAMVGPRGVKIQELK